MTGVKVRTTYTRTPYITPGKWYTVFDVSLDRRGGSMLDDEGEELFIYFKNSSHIDCGEWEVVDT